jgi:hypothetical protein
MDGLEEVCAFAGDFADVEEEPPPAGGEHDGW